MKKLGLLATVMAAIAFSAAPALAVTATQLPKPLEGTIEIGGTTINWSTSFVAAIDILPAEVVFIPLNWEVIPLIVPGGDVEEDMFIGVEKRRSREKGGETWVLEALEALGAVSFNGVAPCPATAGVGGGAFNLPFFANFQVCVPVVWSDLRCKTGTLGKGKAHLKLFLTVVEADDEVTETDVGFGFSLQVRDPNCL